MTGTGPLQGLRVLEFAGIGPGPFCGMLLSDLGADVLRIDRKGGRTPTKYDVTSRGRRSLELDLKEPEAIELCLRLAGRADALFEGFRPGVMERFGLGPEPVFERNPRLVYGRMTGWGQTGPYAPLAGHDINYIAISGALHAIGPKARPEVPLNLVGDFGGGALYLAFGLLAGVLHARRTGQGQVVDCAMSDGAASLMALLYGLKDGGTWKDARESNFIDGGAHFYTVYECADGKWLSVGSLEPQFYRLLLEKTGVGDPRFAEQYDHPAWPELKTQLAAVFRTRTREQWMALFENSDACVAPVLSMGEAPGHPHNLARNTFEVVDGVTQPGPAPRFSATPGRIQGPPRGLGYGGEEALRDWGVVAEAVATK